MITYDRPASITAFQAISEAQKLAFSPIAFQASVALVRLGILDAVGSAGEEGARAEELAQRLGLGAYGVSVLLDMGLSIGLVWRRGDRYVLDKVGPLPAQRQDDARQHELRRGRLLQGDGSAAGVRAARDAARPRGVRRLAHAVSRPHAAAGARAHELVFVRSVLLDRGVRRRVADRVRGAAAAHRRRRRQHRRVGRRVRGPRSYGAGHDRRLAGAGARRGRGVTRSRRTAIESRSGRPTSSTRASHGRAARTRSG